VKDALRFLSIARKASRCSTGSERYIIALAQSDIFIFKRSLLGFECKKASLLLYEEIDLIKGF